MAMSTPSDPSVPPLGGPPAAGTGGTGRPGSYGDTTYVEGTYGSPTPGQPPTGAGGGDGGGAREKAQEVAEEAKAKAQEVDYEFVPGARDILQELLPLSFKVRLFKCFLDAAVSEQIARRVAMKAATENAADLIKSLSQQYNRARQANITKEISELIAGAEALK